MIAVSMNQPDSPNLSYYAQRQAVKLVDAGLLQQRDITNTIQLASAILKSVVGDPDQYLEQLLGRLKDAGVAEIGNEILRVLARKYSSQTNAIPIPEVEGAEPAAQAKSSPRNGDGEPAPKRGRRIGKFDIAEKQNMSSLRDTRKKIALIELIEGKCQGVAANDMIPSLRSMHYTVVRPVLNCLRQHCQNDVDAFIRRWGQELNHSNWSRDRCPKSSRNKDKNVCGFFVE
jgi:hypothetical protein